MSRNVHGRRRATPAPAPARATSTPGRGHRVAPKAKRSVLRAPTALSGIAIIALAIFGVQNTSNSALPAQFDTVASDYADGTQYGTTNAKDISRSATARETELQTAQQAEQTRIAMESYNANATNAARETANQWVLPTTGYVLTARFGDRGSHWSSGAHSGLDFAGAVGTPLVAVAAGTVKEAGYSGAYGNRTIFVLEDGTEIWYCHQSRISVTEGEQVLPGEVIGYLGGTGNVTGPHLHLEIHPNGGDAVDPYAELVEHGVTP